VVTNATYVSIVRDSCFKAPVENILDDEPVARNTAPCIGYATLLYHPVPNTMILVDACSGGSMIMKMLGRLEKAVSFAEGRTLPS